MWSFLIKEKSETLQILLLQATAIFTIIAVTWSSFVDYTGWLSLALLLILGIPHGAVDHLVTLGNDIQSKSLNVKFYLQYALYMVLMGFLWYLFPKIAFFLFLLFSAFHFGQSQWHNIRMTQPFRYALYLNWGLLILSIIICFNMEQCIWIVNSMGWNLSSYLFTSDIWNTVFHLNIILLPVLLCCAWFMKRITLMQIIHEIAFLLMISIISIHADALFAFAVYFGIWHSVKSLLLEFEFLNPIVKTPRRFIVKLIPYTLLSLIGIVGAHYLIKLYLPGVSFYMVLFVMISILTVPHLMSMYPLYESIKNPPVKSVN